MKDYKYIAIITNNKTEPELVCMICCGEVMTLAPPVIAGILEHMALIVKEKLGVPYYRLASKGIPEDQTDVEQLMEYLINEVEEKISDLRDQQTLEVAPGLFVPVGANGQTH